VKKLPSFLVVLACAVLLVLAAAGPTRANDYAVVVSKDTLAAPGWKAVVDALVAKHDAHTVTWADSPRDALAELATLHPRYTCFVAHPGESGKDYVATVHQLTRQYDDDPYTDTLWGILTGYDAANALKIARENDPLTIRKVASGTEIALEKCVEGLWYDELVKNKLVRKKPGGTAEQEEGPDDTTQAFADTLGEWQPDLFVTSGHATERNWMIGFRYRNGFFVSKAGQMFGQDTSKRRIEIDSPNPKVYLAVGNCLMGHINGPDAMALAWMNDVGVRQMVGYTVPTWFGYAGWGLLDYFVEQPGRYTLTEAFFANHHALVHRLQTAKKDRRGLQFDRDVVAFYGDPAWEARMADGANSYDQELVAKDGVYTLTITPRRGAESFAPVNMNGSQRGWRPIVAYLPGRVRGVEILDGADLDPVITDDFVLVPNPRECDPQRSYVVRFRAEPVAEKPEAASSAVIDRATATVEGETAWYDARLLGIEGQGWTDTAAPYDRLPARAEGKVRKAVWSLSRHSAGLCVRFVTDADRLEARWTLTSNSLAMPHMPATGVSGLDLYVKTSEGTWRWLAVGRPSAKTNKARLVGGIPAGSHEYLLYLPLYNGVQSVEIGVPTDSGLSKAPPRASDHRPVVFYGTSITQGGCASRPGMVHTAILGRWLDAPVINLGFSGNGRMEAEVATLMAELDPSVFVIDCLPNIGAKEVTERTEPLVSILRRQHPTTPIVLVEDRSYTDAFLLASKRERNETSRAALRAVYDKLRAGSSAGRGAGGDEHLHYLPGAKLLGDDGEGTVDSSHPTDLGFFRQAEAFRAVLEPLLRKPTAAAPAS